MSCCSGCGRYLDAERQFGTAIAFRDLERYRRKGPDATSRLLLGAVAVLLKTGDSLLDIGGGVGVIGFELLARGVRSATLIDASPAYADAARGEAERRQLVDRLAVASGDFTGLAAAVAPAHVVTMHRVICCYPNYSTLLKAAVGHSRRLLAFSYPRDTWYVRAWVALQNLRRRAAGNGFRTFVHDPMAMEAIVTRGGFHRVHRRFTLGWCVELYERPADP
jgi:magnesium-protoporphyrin O-methyltransferase